MRVMVFVHATEDSEKGDYSGHADEFEAMGKYNEELVKAGDHAGRRGPRAVVARQAGRLRRRRRGSRVIDGPFAEAKEVIGGFWIWQVSSMEEAVEWLRRAPFRGQQVELRRIVEPADFEGQLPQRDHRERGAAARPDRDPAEG